MHSVFNLVDHEPPPPGCHTKVSVRSLSHITLPGSDVLAILLQTLILQRVLVLMEHSLLLKNLTPQISISITFILNKSLSDGFFQSKWKDCNLELTPVFKSDQKDAVSNYCGIVLLLIVSKVLERQVHTRLY